MDCYPLKLSWHVKDYCFGGRLIADVVGKVIPPGRVAETWEVSDYRETTGTIKNGHYEGRTLRDLVREFPEELVGRGWHGPHFPLLLKFLDASQMLPIHLHADDETALRKYGEPNGKTEAWHILWAAEGSTILGGVREGLTQDDLFEAFRAQDYEAVMHRQPIQPGDTVYIPAGTIHSLGPDTVIFEVQQTSDLGQFVTPTDLYGYPLDSDTWHANIAAALDELSPTYVPHPNPGLTIKEGLNRRRICCAGPYFALERWALEEEHIEATHARRFMTITNIGETVHLNYSSGTTQLERGESCVLPAAIGEVHVAPASVADLITCYVPDLEQDVRMPLRAAGYSNAEILALGETAN